MLSGTAVNGNAAAGNGGGIAVNAHSSFIYPSAALDGSGSFVANSSVSNNRSGGNGGGVYSENPDSGDYHMLAMQMQGALIDDNVARGSGGGIYGAATSSATLHAAAGSEASSMSISRNIAGASGGGVYLASVQSSSFYGNGAALEGNTAGSEVARGDGGGVYLASNEGYATYGFSESSTQQKNAVSDNHAYGNGGGVYAVSGQQSYGQVEGVDIDGNVAEESGGGIYAKASYASLSMHGGWDPETGIPAGEAFPKTAHAMDSGEESILRDPRSKTVSSASMPAPTSRMKTAERCMRQEVRREAIRALRLTRAWQNRRLRRTRPEDPGERCTPREAGKPKAHGRRLPRRVCGSAKMPPEPVRAVRCISGRT